MGVQDEETVLSAHRGIDMCVGTRCIPVGSTPGPCVDLVEFCIGHSGGALVVSILEVILVPLSRMPSQATAERGWCVGGRLNDVSHHTSISWAIGIELS